MSNVFSDAQIQEIMEIFTQTYGAEHRQYIGARYVPIFGRKNEDSIEWDDSAPYEPLTIVLHEGNSYTSRQYVPTGIDILNEAYWANTGNYNAQVEQYRLETAQYRAIVDETVIPAVNKNAEDIEKLEKLEKRFFDTIADMKIATNLEKGMICHTNGFHANGDNGAAWYLISDNGAANEMDVIKCGALYATLIFTNNAVTPEMLGAYGNGNANDSAVFNRILQLAISGEVGILNCAYEAVYNLANSDVFNADFYENLQINGNNCTFKNGSFIFNLESKTAGTWKVSYPRPSIIVRNCTFNNESYDQPPFISGSPIIFEFCSFDRCNGAVAYPFVYMDVNIFKNCTFTRFRNKFINVSTANYNNPSATFGDNHIYVNCHSHQQTELDEGLFISAYGCNPLVIDNCINIGVYMQHEGHAKVSGCHFESKPIEFSSASVRTQTVHFTDCVFLASIPDAFVANESVRYDDCTWLVNASTYFKNNNNGNLFNINGANNKIMFSDETGGYPSGFVVYAENEIRNRFRTGTYTNDIAAYTNVNNNNNALHEFPQTGTYKYNIFLSVFKDTIVGAQPSTWEKTFDVTNMTTAIRFQVSSSIHNMWLHFYRTLPSGKVQKAVVQYGERSNSVYDTGITLASVPWEDVNVIPSADMTGIASLSGNTLVTSNDYVDNTHASILSINQNTNSITGFAPQTATVTDF